MVVVSYFRDQSRYPRTASRARQDVYWASIAVQAATLRHVDPGIRFVVYAGDEPRGQAAQVLSRAGGEIRHAAFDHQPPRDFYARYAGSLYVLDTMAALVDQVRDDDVIVFVDPDLAWAGSPDPLVDEVCKGGVVAYDLGVPDDLSMCDLTRQEQAQVIAEELGATPAVPPHVHFGGELYGMRGAELRDVQPSMEWWWDTTLQRYQRGLPHFTVEEHLMNAVLWERGEQRGRANGLMERIRTLPPPFSTRDRCHDDLVAWHLPFEKDRAFPSLLRHLAGGHPLPEPGPQYRAWLRRRMGIDPTPARWVMDRAHQAKWTLERRRPTRATPYGL